MPNCKDCEALDKDFLNCLENLNIPEADTGDCYKPYDETCEGIPSEQWYACVTISQALEDNCLMREQENARDQAFDRCNDIAYEADDCWFE